MKLYELLKNIDCEMESQVEDYEINPNDDEYDVTPCVYSCDSKKFLTI